MYTYIRRVLSTRVRTFGVVLDNLSVENPVQAHGFNQGQEFDLRVLNQGASEGVSIKSI